MARQKNSDEGGAVPPRRRNTERAKGHHEHHPEPNDSEGGEEPTQGEQDTDPAKVHRDYLERHLGGGAPATPEAYARANKQWRQLPGAVRVPPTELTGNQAALKPSDKSSEASTPASEAQEEEHES